jgi:hypothetical protein
MLKTYHTSPHGKQATSPAMPAQPRRVSWPSAAQAGCGSGRPGVPRVPRVPAYWAGGYGGGGFWGGGGGGGGGGCAGAHREVRVAVLLAVLGLLFLPCGLLLLLLLLFFPCPFPTEADVNGEAEVRLGWWAQIRRRRGERDIAECVLCAVEDCYC